MEEMEEKLGSILGNPQMMQQIMAMAQALGQQNKHNDTPPPQPQPKPQPAPQKQMSLPQLEGIDLASVQRIAGLAQKSQIDSNQRSLLRALAPYLSRDRINKLEKAMRAAKIAAVAGTVLSRQGSYFNTGR